MGSIAFIPFTDEGFRQSEREFYANMFATEFRTFGSCVVTRNSANSVIFKELNYQHSGNTETMTDIGKQLKVGMVLFGNLTQYITPTCDLNYGATFPVSNEF